MHTSPIGQAPGAFQVVQGSKSSSSTTSSPTPSTTSSDSGISGEREGGEGGREGGREGREGREEGVRDGGEGVRERKVERTKVCSNFLEKITFHYAFSCLLPSAAHPTDGHHTLAPPSRRPLSESQSAPGVPIDSQQEAVLRSFLMQNQQLQMQKQKVSGNVN